MNFIFIPGNSKQNKSWIKQVKDEFSELYDKAEILEYNHWETGENILDFEEESQKLLKICENFGPFNILAKSAGCLIALKLISEGKIKPEECLFIGFPLGFGRSLGLNIDLMLKNCKVPILFIQKTQDPVMHSKELKKYLTALGMTNYELKEIPGSEHHYEDIDLLKSSFTRSG